MYVLVFIGVASLLNKFLPFHPLNAYPARVGVGSVPYALPYVTVALVGVTLPPFALYVTVYVLGVQFAVSVPAADPNTYFVPLVFVTFITSEYAT